MAVGRLREACDDEQPLREWEISEWELELALRRVAPWRQGRKVPNHVYAQLGPEPSDSDPWVGSFPMASEARRAVEAVNAELEREQGRPA